MSKSIVPTQLTVADFLTDAFVRSERTLDEIAEGVGCEKPVIFDAVLKGSAKLPVTLVFPLAKLLGIDPALLLRIYLRDYMPDLERAMHDCQGMGVVSMRERSLLESFRKATGDTDPQVMIFEDRKVVALALA